jgi:hypothetical protein
MSIAISLPSASTDQFNIRQSIFAQATDTLLNKQLTVGFALVLLILTGLSINAYFAIRTMRNAAQLYENEALEALKDRPHFKRGLEDELKGVKEKYMLEKALEYASEEVKRQEALWFAFAGPARASVLKYLLELTNIIDKEGLGFVIESLSISEGTMTIKAQVKSHEALKLLEKDLKKSPLFKYVPRQEQPNFIMKITLATNGEEPL